MGLERQIKISEAVFTVVDLETTGGVQPENSIIEICAIKVQGGRVLDVCDTLVNPHIPIPYFISQYTGITNDMVGSAPAIKEILPKFLNLVSGTVFVAHNVPFDFGFINMELAKNGYEKIENRWLCTLRLARRLLPKQQRANLGELSAYFGIQIQNRHRARGDSDATVKVLYELINLAREQHGVEDIEDLLSLQFRAIRHFKKEPRHFQKLRRETIANIPAKSGVYLMKSDGGDVLYVGKSKNLKARVSSYFNQNTDRAEKVNELVSYVRKIDYILTGTELEALLLESKLIKLHRPRYNTLLKRYRSYPFIRLTAHDFPKLEIAADLQKDGAEYFGPFSSMDVVSDVLEILNRHFLLRNCSDQDFRKNRTCIYLDLKRCLAPCDDGPLKEQKYKEEIMRVRNFLSGRDPEILVLMAEKMKVLAEEQRYEEASETKSKIKSLRRVFYRQASITASVNENNVVILLPSEKYSDACKEFVLLFVRFGRLVAETKVLDDDVLSLGEFIGHIYFNGHAAPLESTKEQIDEMQILAGWIYRNRTSLSCLYVRPEHRLSSLHEELVERMTKLSSLSIPELQKELGVSDETELS
ncbi:MAG: DEDD exonuclease domain-containing protein [Chlorobiales bacterium]|nr:DEDD exonuclease domain-containing protein [Chlorobiales bacterium]